MLDISDVVNRVLSEDTGEGSRSEAIARAIAAKAENGDVSAVKFLRELAEGNSEKTCEIRVNVIE